MFQIFKKNQFIVLSVIAIIFFFIYSFLIFGNSLSKFTWPDETANYFFIKNYIEHSSFSVPEPLNEIAGNLIKPRSFNVYQGNLVPGSFLGMILIYGLIGKIVGAGLIKFLTPLLAAIAGLFFYKILLKIFNPQIAFLSVLLFYANPAWWYYANFSMLPNIAFFTFLIIGLYFLLNLAVEKKRNNILFVILSSLFVSFALVIRTNEFLWILAVLIILLSAYYKKIKWYYVVIFLSVCFLVFLPIFYYNQITYGSYWSFGYLRLEQGDNIISQLPTEFKISGPNIFTFIRFLLLPFGFHLHLFVANFYKYVASLFWWLFIPALLGGLIFVKNFREKKSLVYFVISLISSLYLLIYYGSWFFADQMTLQLNKIGISYVRYFLPIYIFSLPFAAIFFNDLINWLKNKKVKILLSFFFALIFLYFTITIVYFSGEDSLVKVKQNIEVYNQINKKVVSLTPDKAVIISQRSDKIFFPERKVIGQWQVKDAGVWADLLKAGVPLYYYAYEGLDYINKLNSDLEKLNLVLVNQVKITEKENLYEIKLISYGK